MANEPEQRPRTEAATCPYCGQPLQGEEAVRHLRMSARTRQVELEAAAREHAAKLGEELAANLSMEHERNRERLERQLSSHDEGLIEERAKHRMVPF